MQTLLKGRINLFPVVNPFYLYIISFSLAVFVYLWGWSDLYPKLSAGLLVFLVISFIWFFISGKTFAAKRIRYKSITGISQRVYDLIFGMIILLGIINVLYMGYLPVLDSSHDYREFGMPVVDPLFNTLSIFFSVVFFQLYLENKTRKHLVFVLIIFLIQAIMFRRATMLWIVISSAFLYMLSGRRISVLTLVAGLICIPLFSWLFGLYGNKRSGLTESYVLIDLKASASFRNTGLSHNHYMTYLYVSSPLANLQQNIGKDDGFINKGDYRNFFFYNILPESFTLRLEKPLHLSRPECNLIMPHLIAGSFFMTGYFTLGWAGMATLMLYLFILISLVLFIIRKWDHFSSVTIAILTTAVSLLIFANFLNRLDVILLVLVYPVLFHLIFAGLDRRDGLAE